MRLLYALTGPPGCGKTTAALKIADQLKSLGVKVDGMYTREMRVGGRRVGFQVTRIATGETCVMAHVEVRDGPRVGRYGVNLAKLERIGVEGIRDGIRSADFVVVDEVGPMELYSQGFIEAVRLLLRSDIHSLLTVHFRAKHPLVQEVKRAAGRKLINLTPKSRDRIPQEITREVAGALRRI